MARARSTEWARRQGPLEGWNRATGHEECRVGCVGGRREGEERRENGTGARSGQRQREKQGVSMGGDCRAEGTGGTPLFRWNHLGPLGHLHFVFRRLLFFLDSGIQIECGHDASSSVGTHRLARKQASVVESPYHSLIWLVPGLLSSPLLRRADSSLPPLLLCRCPPPRKSLKQQQQQHHPSSAPRYDWYDCALDCQLILPIWV